MSTFMGRNKITLCTSNEFTSLQRHSNIPEWYHSRSERQENIWPNNDIKSPHLKKKSIMNCCLREEISPLIIHCGNGCVFSALPCCFLSAYLSWENTYSLFPRRQGWEKKRRTICLLSKKPQHLQSTCSRVRKERN